MSDDPGTVRDKNNEETMKTTLQMLLILLAIHSSSPVTPAVAGAEVDGKPSVLGRRIPSFVLPDSTGKNIAFSDFNDSKTLVVVFLGTQCPIGNSYVPVLSDLQKRYRDQGLQVIAVNSNLADDAKSVAKHATEFKIDFPVFVDDSQVVADLFGARRTPEAFVLDRRRHIRYRGRIDDRFGYSYKRDKARRSDVEEAVKELLAGKAVSIAETEPAGCIITRESRLKIKGEITFAKHVSRILQKNCADCHHPGTAAPFSLLKYEDARNWSGMVRETVVERRMPPWSADPRFGHWANDLRMSTEDIDTLVAWIDGGMPLGDRKDLPQPREYADGWLSGTPDIIFKIPSDFTVQAQGTVKYQYFVTPTNFKEDVWVQASEARPGNWDAVHHIIVYVREKGTARKQGLPAVAGFAPGEEPMVLPQGVGFKVPAGSELVWQLHYTPTGKVEHDRSEVGLYLCKERPQREVKGDFAINFRFAIPPGAESHEVVAQAKINKDVEVISFTPHMHLRGRNFKYTAHYPDGRKEVLLSVPNYDFNWQHRYRPAKPLVLPAGTTIHCVAHFDNSIHNPANPDPTKPVRWGDQSWEEMMIGFFSTVDALPIASSSNDIWSAAHTGNVKAVSAQLAAGADINGRGSIGNTTPLVIAAIYGQKDVAALLIKKGADLSISSDDGATPLLIAAFFGHRDIVEQLLQNGADVNAKNKDGRTPLDTVSGKWGPAIEGVYKYFAGVLQVKLDLAQIRKARPEIADLLRRHKGKLANQLPKQ